jgi:hypothetical protein
MLLCACADMASCVCRVAAHAAALLRDLDAFTALCFTRSRSGTGGGGGAGGASGAPAPVRPPFFFAAGSPLEGARTQARDERSAATLLTKRCLARMRAGPGGGCVIRFAAEEADAAYAWARAALAPLHGQLGGAPYRI